MRPASRTTEPMDEWRMREAANNPDYVDPLLMEASAELLARLRRFHPKHDPLNKQQQF